MAAESACPDDDLEVSSTGIIYSAVPYPSLNELLAELSFRDRAEDLGVLQYQLVYSLNSQVPVARLSRTRSKQYCVTHEEPTHSYIVSRCVCNASEARFTIVVSHELSSAGTNVLIAAALRP